MNKVFPVFFLLGILFYSCLNLDSNPYKQGKKLYEDNCQNCHQEDGKALEGLIPPLAGSDYLQKNKMNVPCIIQYGMEGEVIVNGKSYNHPMPGITILTPIQIANIVNYISNEWGNDYGYISYEDVVKALENCDQPD